MDTITEFTTPTVITAKITSPLPKTFKIITPVNVTSGLTPSKALTPRISTPKFSIPTDDSSNYASGYDPRNKTSLTSSRRIGSETMERNQSLKRQKSITLSEKELKQTVKPSVFRIVQKTVKTKIMKTLRGIHEFLVSKKDATFHSLYQITIILMKPIHV